jgi:replication factor A1
MKISELKAGQGNVNVEGHIKEMGEPRSFNKFGKQLSVTNAVLEDDSGSIKLTLWNDDISRFKEGDSIRIVNGFVNEFQGEIQLTSGKFGRIEKIGEGESESSDDDSESKSSKKSTKKLDEFKESEDDSEESESIEDDSGVESEDIEEVEY